jgi:hypothetical protein
MIECAPNTRLPPGPRRRAYESIRAWIRQRRLGRAMNSPVRLSRLARNVFVASVGALALFTAAPLASIATTGPTTPTMVPTYVDTRVIPHPCFDNSGRQCKLVVTTTVPAHYLVPGGTPAPLNGFVTQAQACYSSRYYIYPSMSAKDYGFGQVVTDIELSAENWYDGCSAGGVWVSFSCTASPGYSCSSPSHGGFWDSGMGYYQDWGNVDTSNVFGILVHWYVRIHAYPNGSWARWCYNTGAGNC